MVKVRADYPTRDDGSVDLAVWLSRIEDQVELHEPAELLRACQFAEQLDRENLAKHNVWMTRTSSFLTGLAMADILAELNLDQDSLMAAVLYLLAASSYVFHVGYFTTQIESPTDNPIWLKLTNKMSSDLTSTGFDRVAAGVGQASPGFFQMADVAPLQQLQLLAIPLKAIDAGIVDGDFARCM